MSSSLLLCFVLCIRHCVSGYGAEDSKLNIEKRCGESYSISLTYDNIERKVFIYVPKIFCDDNDALATFVNKHMNHQDIVFDPSSHQITIPMLIPLHCLSGSAQQEMSKWISFAEEFTFIVLAPQGSGSIPSWNGDQCCDPAVSDDIDDVGFIQTVINGAQTSFSGIFPSVTVRNDNYDGYVWLTGYSNGAFMSDKIAWLSTVNQFSKLVAVAPMGGYIYDHTKYTHNADKYNSVAVFFHHTKADDMVNANGCCMDQAAGCCCNIAPKSSTCVSIYEEYQNWLEWNHCDDNIHYEDIKSDSIIHDPASGEEPVPITCAFATPQDHGCATHTALCMYGGDTHHTSWTVSPPQGRNVIVFFLKALCLQQGGTFNAFTVHCECGTDSIYDGLHCISPKTALGIRVVDAAVDGDGVKEIGTEMNMNMDMNSDMERNMNMEHEMNENERVQMRNNKDLSVLGTAADKYADKTFEFDSLNGDTSFGDTWSHIPNTSIVLLCTMLFTSFGLFVMYKKRQSGYRYSKINMHDEETPRGVLLN